MKLLDANVLLHALNQSSRQHDVARTWLERALSGSETVAFAWSALLAVFRIGTRGVVFQRPLTVDEAVDAIEGWLAQPPAVIVHPTDRHPAVLRDLLAPLGTAGNLVPDAHLAALAIEHGAELVSFDNDFSRFPGLRWTEPGRG